VAEINLRCAGKDRGTYFPTTQRVIVYLNNHESLDDIYKTIQHELIHHVLNILDVEMDDEQEERAIFNMAWAEESLI